MTTAFQYVFDNAESIGWNRRATVAQTITRNNTVRSVSRGAQTWRFDVKLPDGIAWHDAREYITRIDSADRFSQATVQINRAGYNDWFTPYQGNVPNVAAVGAAWVTGANSITLTSGQASAGQNFRAGDLVQLGSTGRVYEVTADVAQGVNTVPVHRPVIDATGSGTLRIGPAVTWRVICTELPTWNVFARDQVAWSGNFVFFEDML